MGKHTNAIFMKNVTDLKAWGFTQDKVSGSFLLA